MAIRLPRIIQAKQLLKRSSSAKNSTAVATGSIDIPRGYLAFYVGGCERKRYVIPMAYLNQPSFQDLLSQAAVGGLTIPEKIFSSI